MIDLDITSCLILSRAIGIFVDSKIERVGGSKARARTSLADIDIYPIPRCQFRSMSFSTVGERIVVTFRLSIGLKK